MKSILSLVSIVLVGTIVFSSCKSEDTEPDEPVKVIWNGTAISFVKLDSADWTLEVNQDRITDKVWITRADNKGIFNIKSESQYSGEDTDGISPKGTRWAFGTTAEVNSLNFMRWAVAHAGEPPLLIGRDMVMFLTEENIYIDVVFTSWAEGNSGGKGGFSYTRSTKN